MVAVVLGAKAVMAPWEEAMDLAATRLQAVHLRPEAVACQLEVRLLVGQLVEVQQPELVYMAILWAPLLVLQLLPLGQQLRLLTRAFAPHKASSQA